MESNEQALDHKKNYGIHEKVDVLWYDHNVYTGTNIEIYKALSLISNVTRAESLQKATEFLLAKCFNYDFIITSGGAGKEFAMKISAMKINYKFEMIIFCQNPKFHDWVKSYKGLITLITNNFQDIKSKLFFNSFQKGKDQSHLPDIEKQPLIPDADKKSLPIEQTAFEKEASKIGKGMKLQSEHLIQHTHIVENDNIGNYQIMHELGKGGFGKAYLANSILDNKRYVIKMIPINTGISQQYERDMINAENEAKIMKNLKHPYIIKIKSYFRKINDFCIVMEYAEDGDLASRLKKFKDENSYIPEERVAEWMIQISKAVIYCHKKRVIHRDIKPANIFIDKTGALKLGDFGIGKLLSSSNEADTVIGTTGYMAPEVAQGMKYAEKADIWALGITLFEICTLKPAKDILSEIVSKNQKLSPRYSMKLEAIASQMVNFKPEQRPDLMKVQRILQEIQEDAENRGQDLSPFEEEKNQLKLANFKTKDQYTPNEKIKGQNENPYFQYSNPKITPSQDLQMQDNKINYPNNQISPPNISTSLNTYSFDCTQETIGFRKKNVLIVYSPIKNQIAQIKLKTKTQLRDMTCMNILFENSSIYIIGGLKQLQPSSDFFSLPLEGKKCQIKSYPNMIQKRSSFGAVLNARIYTIFVTGGKTNSSGLSNCEKFDFKKEVWKPFPSLNEKRFYHGLIEVESMLFVCGGFSDFHKKNVSIEVFDLSRFQVEQWKKILINESSVLLEGGNYSKSCQYSKQEILIFGEGSKSYLFNFEERRIAPCSPLIGNCKFALNFLPSLKIENTIMTFDDDLTYHTFDISTKKWSITTKAEIYHVIESIIEI